MRDRLPTLRQGLRQAFAALALCAAASRSAATAPVPVHVILPDIQREELAAAPLTAALYERVGEEIENGLNVRDGQGRGVPFVVETVTTSRTEAVRVACDTESLSASGTPSNELVLVAQLVPTAAPATGVTVDTPLRDFNNRVRVEGRSANGLWVELVPDASIYGLGSFVDVRQCDVAWRRGDCRSFRITIREARADVPLLVREITRRDGPGGAVQSTRQDVRTEPFRVERLRFWRSEDRVVERVAVLTPRALPCLAVTTQGTSCVSTFRSSREPLTRLTFATSERLFCRPFRLYGRDDDQTWTEEEPGRLLASGTLTSVRFREIDWNAMDVAIPLNRHRRYVLVCPVGETAAAAGVTVTRAEGPLQRVVFVAQPGGQYTVEAREGAAPPPESAAVRNLLERGVQALVARLEDVPALEEPQRARPWIDRRAAMNGAMVVAALVLAAALLRASRRLDRPDA